MPKSTFFNLSEEKKERVIKAAIDEFAEYQYHQASITRIIKKADIASGSFYQYFEDKKDLYRYIIGLVGERKKAYLKHVSESMEKLNFFELLRELYIGGIRFAKENPKMEAIGNRVAKDINDPEIRELFGDQLEKAKEFFYSLLKSGIETKDIDPGVDIMLVARLLLTINFSLLEFIYEDGRLDSDDIEIIEKVLYIIENGIKNKNSES